MESYDFVPVDLGRALAHINLPMIKVAEVVVLIVGTDLSSAIVIRTVWEYLKNRGIDSRRLYPFQNQSVGLKGLTETGLEQMIGMQIQLTMPYMGGNFTIANNRHEPVIAKYPNEASTPILKQAAIQITELGERVPG